MAVSAIDRRRFHDMSPLVEKGAGPFFVRAGIRVTVRSSKMYYLRFDICKPLRASRLRPRIAQMINWPDPSVVGPGFSRAMALLSEPDDQGFLSGIRARE